MNSYFASVEQQANPFLRGKAIGVTGKRKERSVVAAASREAKKLGVKTAMSTWEAKKILPSIILVAGDPEKYGDITRRFNAIFRDYTDLVEQFSVDESFLDVTDTAKDYLGATAIALTIRDRLRRECGELITASIGIAPNKLMAKLSSERVKPNGITVTQPHQLISLLDSVELQDICGIGPRIADRLDRMGIRTVKQLRGHRLDELVREFKSYGYWLHEAAHGRGDDKVNPNTEDPKSVGHSYTLPTNTSDPIVIQHYLLALCDKVGWRLRRDGFAARCVTVYVRYGDFSGDGKQRRFQEAVNDGLALFEIGWELLSNLQQTHRAPLQDTPSSSLGLDSASLSLRSMGAPSFRPHEQNVCWLPVRLVGINTSQLVPDHRSIPLFKKDQKMVSALSALDKLQTRYGDTVWTRASLLKTDVLARTSGFRYDHEL